MVLSFEGTCSDRRIASISEKPGRKASYRLACKRIKEQYPQIYEDLALDFYNPWEDDTKIITHNGQRYLHINHSQIDYLFLIT